MNLKRKCSIVLMSIKYINKVNIFMPNLEKIKNLI